MCFLPSKLIYGSLRYCTKNILGLFPSQFLHLLIYYIPLKEENVLCKGKLKYKHRDSLILSTGGKKEERKIKVNSIKKMLWARWEKKTICRKICLENSFSPTLSAIFIRNLMYMFLSFFSVPTWKVGWKVKENETEIKSFIKKNNIQFVKSFNYVTGFPHPTNQPTNSQTVELQLQLNFTSF